MIITYTVYVMKYLTTRRGDVNANVLGPIGLWPASRNPNPRAKSVDPEAMVQACGMVKIYSYDW